MAKQLTKYEKFKLQQKLKEKFKKEKEEKIKKRKKIIPGLYKFAGLGKIISTLKGEQPAVKGERRVVARRARGTEKFLGALGVTEQARGRGRPRGTYKYGLPIHEFKKQEARKRALYQLYRQEQLGELARRGLTPEQVQQIQYKRTIEEGRLPVQKAQPELRQQVPQEFEETPERVMTVADNELAFKRFVAQKTISPNTQRMLVRLRRVQLKSQSDDIEMQRRLREKKMIAAAGNIMETPFVFNKHQMDITRLAEGDKEILKAPNVFKENPENNILKRIRWGILNTKETGNDLQF